MKHKAKSIRAFIGSKNFEISRQFYKDLGFIESLVSPNMSVFWVDGLSFYLQDYYVKDWVENSMIFLEVDDADRYWEELAALKLEDRYERVKLSTVQKNDWEKSVSYMIRQESFGTSEHLIPSHLLAMRKIMISSPKH